MTIVFSQFTPRDPDTKARNDAAYATWVSSGVKILPYEGQNSSEVGDPCAAHFVADMLNAAFELDDTVIICNNDIKFTPNTVPSVAQSCAEYGCFWAYRINEGGHADGGLDLFGLSKWWWTLNKDIWPDALISYRGWDQIMKQLMETSGCPEGPRCYIHTDHHNNHQNRLHTPGARWNEAIWRDWCAMK